MKKMVFLIQVIILVSCTPVVDDKMIDACKVDDPHSIVENDSYRAYLYYPDRESAPEVWEGPICVQPTSSQPICRFEESIIKSVKFVGADTLEVETFSGSNATWWRLDLKSCRYSPFL